MIMAIVDFDVAPENRTAALDILHSDGAAAAKMRGNKSFRVFTNAGSETHIGLMHEWETMEAFQAYTNSEGFAKVRDGVGPLMTAPPVSKRLKTELVE